MSNQAKPFVRIEGIDLPTMGLITRPRDPFAGAVIGYEPASHPVLGRIGWRVARLLRRLLLWMGNGADAIDEHAAGWRYRKPVYDEAKLKAIRKTMSWGFAEFPAFVETGDVVDE